jgi:hypothetical protein
MSFQLGQLSGLVNLIRMSNQSISENTTKQVDEFNYYLHVLFSEYAKIEERYISLANILARFTNKEQPKPSLTILSEFDRIAKIIHHFETEIESIKELEANFSFIRERYKLCKKCQIPVLTKPGVKTECPMCKETTFTDDIFDKDLVKAVLTSGDSPLDVLMSKKDEYEFLWLSNCRKILDDASVDLTYNAGLGNLVEGVEKTEDAQSKIKSFLGGGNNERISTQ